MRLRRSMLFVPATKPGAMRDAYVYQPDAVMFDLEDSVAISEKDSARILLFNMLKKFGSFYRELGIETVVRVNALDTPYGLLDLEATVRAGADVIRIPKAECADDVKKVESHVVRIEREAGIPIGSTKIMVAIESPLGALNALEIARSSDRLTGLALGGEDYVTNLKTSRSSDGVELFMARSMIVMAARAVGIAALDTVYSDFENEEGFIKEAQLIKQLGFDGKSLIHPNQIALIHSVYTPDAGAIEKAIKIVQATKQADKDGHGVFSVDGKMIDKPIIARAEHVLRLAKASGIKITEEEGE